MLTWFTTSFPWLATHFVHPMFLMLGAPLVAAPIIIHLINRLNYRRVRWAAMEFLLESQQKARRRVMLEQLLLLLLRILMVLFIVILLARLLLKDQQRAFLQGLKTHHLLVVDDSGSMQDRFGDTTAFQSALDVAKRLGAEGGRKQGTQTLTLVLASQPDQPVITLRTLDGDFQTELERRLGTLQCTFGNVDLPEAIEASRRLLVDQPGAARLMHIISDFRALDWEEDSALPKAIQEVHASEITVNLVKTVSKLNTNLGIMELTGSLQSVSDKLPVQLSVKVKNHGEATARKVRLNVYVDGDRLPSSIPIDQLEPGKEITQQFEVTFGKTGRHQVRVELPADALAIDNDRHLVVNVPDKVPVLIVNGDRDRTDATYLSDALYPDPDSTSYRPVIETPDVFRRGQIERYQSLILVNVGDLSDDALAKLEAFVEGGGGLVWFMGSQVKPAFYNEKLYKEGEGIFPAKLASIAELPVDEANPAPDMDLIGHRMFKTFQGGASLLVKSVRVSKYFATQKEWAPISTQQVIGTLRNKAPLFITHRYGKGTVVTCMASVDTAFWNWPLNPTYAAFAIDLAGYVGGESYLLDQREVGQPIDIALDASLFNPGVEIRRPEGTGEVITAVIDNTKKPAAKPGAADTGSKPVETGDGSEAPTSDTPVYRERYLKTGTPGVYSIVQKRQDGTSELRQLAYNVPVRESEQALVPTDRLKARIGSEVPVMVQEPGEFNWLNAEQAGQEVHDLILLGLLAILLCEQLLAWRLSYHPDRPAAKPQPTPAAAAA